MICDAQVHIWQGDSVGPRVPGEPWPHPGGAFGAGEQSAVIAAAGVDRAILVPPSAQGDRNDVALAAAARCPRRFAVMGRLPLRDPASRDAIAGWRAQTGMLGLRLSFSRERGPLLADANAEWLWTEAECAGVPIMLMVPGQVRAVEAVAREHPGLRLVIDHLGRLPGVQDDAAFADLDELLELARYANVAVKASALPRFSSEPYPHRNLHPYVQRIVDAFTPQRVMWGTDLSRMRCSYRDAVTMVTEEMPFLSADDCDWIMGRTACAWLGWPV
jgi:L-fuconolactonase